MARINRAAGLENPLQSVFPQPVVASRSPSGNDKSYPIGQKWIDQSSNQVYALTNVTSGSATWTLTGPGASDVDTLTGDTGGALSPTGGNINILGGDGLTIDGVGSTLTVNRDAEGGYPITPFVVGAAGQAGYTTIQAAVNAANSAGGGMVYVQPGTYTEDLTLFDNVFLSNVSYLGVGALAAPVILTGTHTPPTSGQISISGFRLVSATNIFSSAAAGTTQISIDWSVMAVTNGYTFNLLNWTGTINCNDCGSDGTEDGFVNNTGGSNVFTNNGQYGAGTTNTCNISGDMRLDLTLLDCPLDVSAGSIFVNFALFSQTVTCSGTSAGAFLLANNFPASGPAYDITSSGTITIENSTITTTNDPAIDGTGSVNVINTGFGSNRNFAATLTVGTGSALVDGTFSTLVPAAHLEITATTIAGIGTDAAISIEVTPKGTGSFDVNSSLRMPNAGTQLMLQGGAVTDFIGQVTLAAGISTVANTNIAATDRIFLTYTGASLIDTGNLSYTITAAVSFTIESTNILDTNTVSYFIVREL